jgi:hypothetical protein
MKTYNELIKLKTFDERFDYLKLNGLVGEETFGYSRYLNQILYRSPEWRHLRREIVARDNGCDLAMPGYEIIGKLIVHHIEPITLKDIEERNPKIYDMNNLVSVSFMTHQALHYGDKNILYHDPVERFPGDTKLW